MDQVTNDLIAAQQKEFEAQALRRDGLYYRDNPIVAYDLDQAARELEKDAANLRAEAAEIMAEQEAAEQE